jgi:hypothetical protein
MSAWVCMFPLVGLLSSGCEANVVPDIPARFGLIQSTSQRDIVEHAIILVNAMLPSEMDLRLRPTWKQSGYYPLLTFESDRSKSIFSVEIVTDRDFDNGWLYRNSRVVPVYIIDQAMLGRVENVFVPEGERCIFVNAQNLDRLFAGFYVAGSEALQQHGSFDKSLVVALVLLHELGHIWFGDNGSYGPPAHLELDELMKPSGSIANKEIRADRFASELLIKAWDSKEMRGPLPGPYGRATIASNIFRIVATGSNTHDLKVDPMGWLDKVRKLEVFRATGYSHLNIYLRFLVILQQLEPTGERASELSAVSAMFKSNRMEQSVGQR